MKYVPFSLSLISALTIASSFATAAPKLETIVSGLKSPVCMASPTDDNDYFYILEQAGQILRFDRTTNKLIKKPFLDLSDQIKSESNEQGLLSIAFSPDFSKDKRFYLNYTNNDGNTVISRCSMQDPENIKQENLLTIKQDYANHNGGWLGFGPDGLLYIATGDGGAANDPKNRAQNTKSLLGKLLRIDVSGKTGYTTPSDNFASSSNTKAAPEILSIGLRNPWRCSWDGDTFYIADVGQNAHEEINTLEIKDLAGANFGWRLREGTHPTPKKKAGGDRPKANIEPILEYPHKEGRSITGGHVYRGQIKELQGHYFYADYVSGNIWSFQYKDGKTTKQKKWNDYFLDKGESFKQITSFTKDAQGEMYILSRNGSIYKIIQ